MLEKYQGILEMMQPEKDEAANEGPTVPGFGATALDLHEVLRSAA